MAVGGGTEEVVFRMILDPSDLKQIMGVGPESIAGGAGGGGVGGIIPPGGTAPPAGSDREGVKVKQDPSFMAIFKPLAALSIIEKGIGGILQNSRVANTYLGAMGKMFGAAIDLLLLPLTPIFNLIMVAMSKLLAWLVESGILEKMYEVFSRAADYLKGILDWMGQIWTSLKEFNMGKLAELIIKGLGSVVKTAVTDPMGFLATVGTIGVGAMMLGKVPGMGSAMGAAGLGARGLAGLGGMAAGGGAMAGLGIAGAAVGGGALGYWGWGHAQDEGASGWAGVGGMAAGGALVGGAVGSIVPGLGTGIGAVAGGAIGGGIGLAKKFGVFGGGGGEAGGGGLQSMENVGNVANIDISINVDGLDVDQMVDRLTSELDEIYREQGYTVRTGSY